ncbi:MAG TPA: hypothetical protein VGN11_07360 [Candidatus Baltobacteraceae bacterium]|jgi:hypothetical protein|nr:hypothetical protein [Candidatus Baltobacteraceae bacterium]
MDKKADAPDYERDVPSDRPYVEDASVPGDNSVRTALDPVLAKRHPHSDENRADKRESAS